MKKKSRVLSLFAVFLLTAVTSGCMPGRNITDETISTVLSKDNSPITFGVRGHGEVTLVFVHCWTCNHEFWRPQIEFFSASNKVVWLDLAGHGLSGSHRQNFSIAAFADDVVAVINQLNLTNVVLVGHSMGGPVAIETAEKLGEKVIGIVGVDTFYTAFKYPKNEVDIAGFVKPFKENFKASSEELVRSMFTAQADPRLVNSIVNQMSVASPAMGTSAMLGFFKWNAEKNPSILVKYEKKLWNINGAPTGKEKRLHDHVMLIPDAGHFVAQVKPDEFNKVLSSIIARLRDS